ncbi:uncharacterized protein BJ171DRAFT_579738 [Polychytrium aggregatum]|uniref:uncharacterized protein n=1 Tax=Polychytrium aggregatum TaxID=110093 RepID=UPI0022FECC24|nr:uncharacterized protein BJ171DRAFT_579738 [Polychytrium aggregatum]KAI9206772.1 hypothetical protein BJ171DRAFT_579738 [Polychytrium aggregatum]
MPLPLLSDDPRKIRPARALLVSKPGTPSQPDGDSRKGSTPQLPSLVKLKNLTPARQPPSAKCERMQTPGAGLSLETMVPPPRTQASEAAADRAAGQQRPLSENENEPRQLLNKHQPLKSVRDQSQPEDIAHHEGPKFDERQHQNRFLALGRFGPSIRDGGIADASAPGPNIATADGGSSRRGSSPLVTLTDSHDVNSDPAIQPLEPRPLSSLMDRRLHLSSSQLGGKSARHHSQSNSNLASAQSAQNIAGLLGPYGSHHRLPTGSSDQRLQRSPGSNIHLDPSGGESSKLSKSSLRTSVSSLVDEVDPPQQLETEGTMQTSSEKWTYVLHRVMKMVRSVYAFKDPVNPANKSALQNISSIGTVVAAMESNLLPTNPNRIVTLSDQLHEMKVRNESLMAAKVKHIVTMPPANRTDDDRKLLDQLLCRLPSFSKFSRKLRMNLAKIMHWEYFGPGRTIIRRGYPSISMYFIVTGLCQSTTLTNINEHIHLSPGDQFGEFSLSAPGEIRTVTVSSLSAVELLRIDKDDYITMFGENDPASIGSRASFFQKLPYFASTDELLLSRLCQVSHIVKFEPGASIVKPGGAGHEHVFILLRGQCRAMRIVPFLKLSSSSLAREPIPYQFGTQVPEGYEVVNEVLAIGDLIPGDYFPKLHILQEDSFYYRSQDVDIAIVNLLLAFVLKCAGITAWPSRDFNANPGLRNHRKTSMMENMAAGLDLSVITIQRVECVMFTKLDFLRAIDLESLKTMIEHEGLLGVSISELQEKFLTRKNWEGYKRKVVAEITSSLK